MAVNAECEALAMACVINGVRPILLLTGTSSSNLRALYPARLCVAGTERGAVKCDSSPCLIAPEGVRSRVVFMVAGPRNQQRRGLGGRLPSKPFRFPRRHYRGRGTHLSALSATGGATGVRQILGDLNANTSPWPPQEPPRLTALKQGGKVSFQGYRPTLRPIWHSQP